MPSLSVGQRILRATEASVAATGLNTNLGIVLLAAPLAKAASETTVEMGLRRRLGANSVGTRRAGCRRRLRCNPPRQPRRVSATSTRVTYALNPKRMTLIAAMHLAAERDRIANAYVTTYSDVFDFALPALLDARAATADQILAVTTLHMALLAEFLDTHIVRKHGEQTARAGGQARAHIASRWRPAATAKSLSQLVEFDTKLKERGLNLARLPISWSQRSLPKGWSSGNIHERGRPTY